MRFMPILLVGVAAALSLSAAAPAAHDVAAGGARAAVSADDTWLDTYPYSTSPGARAEMDVVLWSPRLNVAKVTILVPEGYTMRIDQRPGTEIGYAVPRSGGLGLNPGPITADDPQRYASDPGAEACAPGPHAAVWSFPLTPLGGRAMKVPVFVDPAPFSDVAGAAYKLQFCLPQPQTSSLGDDGFELDVTAALTNPTQQGGYDWRTVIAPPTPAGAPDVAASYELRSLVGVPSALSLSGRYDRHRHEAVLTGRFTAPGIDVDRTPISLFEYDPDEHLAPWREVTWHRTDSAGGFTFRRRIGRTTKFGVRVESIGDCSTQPAAVAPCLDETLADIGSRIVQVRKR